MGEWLGWLTAFAIAVLGWHEMRLMSQGKRISRVAENIIDLAAKHAG